MCHTKGYSFVGERGNMDKKEIKARKKAYKKARSKATRPWKWLTWISAPLAIICNRGRKK